MQVAGGSDSERLIFDRLVSTIADRLVIVCLGFLKFSVNALSFIIRFPVAFGSTDNVGSTDRVGVTDRVGEADCVDTTVGVKFCRFAVSREFSPVGRGCTGGQTFGLAGWFPRFFSSSGVFLFCCCFFSSLNKRSCSVKC